MKLKKNMNYNTRKIHRYLGVIIGVQFLFWTIGGLYFSWNNMDDVHGETLLKQDKKYFENVDFSKVQVGIDSLKKLAVVDSIHSIKLVETLGETFLQLKYFSNNELNIQLIDTETGLLRSDFSEKECLEIASQQLIAPISIIKTEFLKNEKTGNHHEYRGKLLPAYVFTLNHSTNTTIYVSTQLGQVTSVRNDNWRRFDFLWMLHTMDYTTRDHITNWVLRIFSVLGILTIFSGFFLFYKTSPTIKKIQNKIKK